MTGQTSSNERGAESSGFVTTTSLIIERRRIVRGADVNYKDKVIRTGEGTGERAVIHYFLMRILLHTYIIFHRGLASFQSAFFLTILRAGPDYSTEGAKPDP